jgi:hypothetical protein
VLFFFLLGAGAWLLLETQCVWVRVSEKGIAYHSPWRRECDYRWHEVREVSTFSYMYPFVFRGCDGRKFTIGATLTNVPLLVKVFRAQLDPVVYEKAQRGIGWSNVRD